MRREEARLYVAGVCILTKMEEPAVDVRLLPRLVLLSSDATAGVDASICRARAIWRYTRFLEKR